MAQAITPPQPSPAAIVLMHDARAIHDTAMLSLPRYIKDGFAAVALVPAADSGSGTIPGAYIKAQTGELVTPPGASAGTRKAGTWKLISSTAPVAESGNYSWVEPLQPSGRQIDPEEIYSPFIHRGTVVFSPRGQPADKGYFQNVALLFDEWARDFDGAAKFAKENESSFGDNPSAEALARLPGLATGANRFLAIQAFRQLVSKGRGNSQLLQSIFARPEPRLLSIATYVLLINGNNVDALLTGARDIVRLREIALGAYTAQLFQAHNLKIAESADATLGSIRQRVGSPETDATLSLIFAKPEGGR